MSALLQRGNDSTALDRKAGHPLPACNERETPLMTTRRLAILAAGGALGLPALIRHAGAQAPSAAPAMAQSPGF